MACNNFSLNAPKNLTDEIYQTWLVKMKCYLQAHDLFEVLMQDIPFQHLPAKPTLAQIKSHNDEKVKKLKVKTLIQNIVADSIFSKIIDYETKKESQGKLKNIISRK